jgi:thioredoxin-like negative regulator of GroEL
MGQLVDEIKPSYKNKVNFVVVFVDEQKEQPVADRFNVQFVPMTFLFDKDGKASDNFSGAVPKATITSKLDELAK